MKYIACFMVAASSVFCAALLAQELHPDTAPNPVSPVVPHDATSPPAPVPLSPPAPISPLPPVTAPPVSVPVAPPPALPSGPLSRAEVAATTWLAVVDAGNYPLSWHQAAGLLQASVPQPKWESSLQMGRQQLGGVKLRTLKTATYSRTLVGAPDGEYVLIQYETQFEFKAQAIETLTTMKDKDNIWKVAGYFIK